MKKIIIGLLGTAILGAAVTYYKTDDPQAAWDAFIINIKEIVNTICEYNS